MYKGYCDESSDSSGSLGRTKTYLTGRINRIDLDIKEGTLAAEALHANIKVCKNVKVAHLLHMNSMSRVSMKKSAGRAGMGIKSEIQEIDIKQFGICM